MRSLGDSIADRLPGAIRLARAGPGRRAVVGTVGVVLAVAAVLGVRLAMATAAARPTAVAPMDPSGSPVSPRTADPSATATATSVTGATGATASAGPSSSPASGLLVHVAGRVRHPGVVRLTAGARVQDALRAAGGALPGSDLVGINLAQPLSDGEQVLVERTGQGSSVSLTGAGGAGAGSAGKGSAGSPVVSLNTGDVSALDALPGVGPVLAQRIVDWRTEHGRFSSVDELDEVSGIGDKLMAEIRPHVRL